MNFVLPFFFFFLCLFKIRILIIGCKNQNPLVLVLCFCWECLNFCVYFQGREVIGWMDELCKDLGLKRGDFNGILKVFEKRERGSYCVYDSDDVGEVKMQREMRKAVWCQVKFRQFWVSYITRFLNLSIQFHGCLLR